MGPTYVVHVNGQTIPNREVGRGFLVALLNAFPNIHSSLEDSLELGDRPAVRWSATATPTGDLILASCQHRRKSTGLA